MYDIVALGEVLIDFTCEGRDGKGYPLLQAHPGGAPANFLAAAAVMGCKTALIGKVGDDSFGRLLVKTLRELKIETGAVKITDEAFTTMAFVTLDDNGDREFSFARKPGADSTLEAADIPEDLIADTKLVHFGSLLMTSETGYNATMRAAELAKKHNKLVSYDPNYRAALWDNGEKAVEMMLKGAAQADIIKISEEEAELLFGTKRESAQRFMAENYNFRLSVLTLGADGAILRSGPNEVFVRAPKVNAVDTTGAGDICGGSVAAGLLGLPGLDLDRFRRGERYLTAEELELIGRDAVTRASQSTERHGGMV